jgi:signal transduction histidine kinase
VTAGGRGGFWSGLGVRMAVAMAATVAVVLLAHGVVLTVIAERYLKQEIETKARDYALLTVRELCEGYNTYHGSSVFQFRQIVRRVLERNPDLTDVRVLDGSGRLLFDSASLEADGEDAVPRSGAAESAPDPWLAAAAAQVVASDRRIPAGGDAGLEIVAPYLESYGQHRQSAAYRVGYASLRTRMREVRWIFGGLLLAATLLATIVGLGVARRIAKPLQKLTAHVEGVSRGDFDATMEVAAGSATEIRILSAAFNRMATELRSYVHSMADSYATLDKVNAELEGRNAELERFTYTVSHDLKSPLITIRSYADFILKDTASGRLDRLERDATRIVEATGRMRVLLDDLLELSRVGRVTNPPVEVPFGDLAREAADLVRGRLDEGRIDLVVDPTLPSVHADRARLVEVLQNLLDNAAKFMGTQPHPRIDVGWREATPPVFYVRDNGVGIDARYHQKVFGLFEKLDPAAGGTGIGLALAKRIVEVHGGRIWVESEGADKGAAFCFTLAAGS